MDSFQVILANYITAAIVGILTIGGNPLNSHTFSQPWFPYAIGLGSVFFYSFNLIALSISKAGVSPTMVAAKMSLVIPTFIGVLIFNEPFSLAKFIGVGIALISVILTLSSSNLSSDEKVKFSFLPVAIFFIAGMQDTVFGYNQKVNITTENANEFTIAVFVCAFAAGLLALIGKVIFGKFALDGKSLLGGVAIGIPNYFSIFFLVKALALPEFGSSVIFPMLNIGIIVISALAAVLFFQEKLSYKNWLGVGLALLAIFFLSQK